MFLWTPGLGTGVWRVGRVSCRTETVACRFWCYLLVDSVSTEFIIGQHQVGSENCLAVVGKPLPTMNQNWDPHSFVHLCYLKYFFHSVDSIFLLFTMYYNLYEEHFSFHFTFLVPPSFSSNFILYFNNCFLSFKKMWSHSRNKKKIAVVS